MPTILPADCDWQTGKSFLECSQYMFENEIACDVKFLVGENKQEIRAHKFILISRSPIFQAMFCAPMAETEKTISIPDVELQSFRLLLRYMYCDHVDFNETNVSQLLSVAKKYCVYGLVKTCTEYFSKIIDTDNAFTLLHSAEVFDIPDLYQNCFVFILENAEICLLSTSFSEMNKACVKNVLEADELLADELTIWKALVIWAETQCRKQEVAVNDANVRLAMDDLVYLIRFCSWDPETFAKSIAVHEYFTEKETANFFRLYHHAMDSVDRFSMKAGRLVYLRCMRFASAVKEITWALDGACDCISFRVTVPIVLCGIIMYGCPTSNSQYKFQMNLTDADGTSLLSESSTMDTSSDEQTFDIMLNKKIKIEKERLYDFAIRMTGNSSYKGNDGKMSITYRGVTVAFANCTKSKNDYYTQLTSQIYHVMI